MGRNLQAGLLLAIFTFAGPAGLAGIFTRLGPRAGGCPLSCCGRARCPMHMRGHGMKCPMAGMLSMPSQAAMNCACSVSPQESSPFPAGPLDMRYDLPRASLFADLTVLLRESLESRVSSLDGFSPLPEQPPRSLPC
jgi:hypothetical protein